MQWILSNLLSTVLCITAVMLVFALSVSFIFSVNSSNFGQSFSIVCMMCLSKIPILLVMMGISACVYGLFPHAATVLNMAIWSLFVAIEFLWEGGFVDWSVMKLMPYAYAHYTTPVADIKILPLLILIALSALLCGIGTFAFSKRNVGEVR